MYVFFGLVLMAESSNWTYFWVGVYEIVLGCCLFNSGISPVSLPILYMPSTLILTHTHTRAHTQCVQLVMPLSRWR